MLQHFRSSPLWLIGLFVIFAEGVSATAAVRLTGWSQQALVVFVIAYASAVTLGFFLFLWFKPENFYSPGDYATTSPDDFIKALRGAVPAEVENAVASVNEDPKSLAKRFSLLSNLLKDEVKQHLVLMYRTGGALDLSAADEYGHVNNYQFLLRNGNMSFGVLSVPTFLGNLRGTDMVIVQGDNKTVALLPEGRQFAEWLIEHRLDAQSFESTQGGWGEPFEPFKILEEKADSSKGKA